MQSQYTAQIEGEFNGYHEDAVFKLTNGDIWQQSRYKYNYHYAYRPRVRVYKDGSQYLMDVEGMNEAVEVRKVSLITEGRITSDFKGYASGERFEFQNGQVWEQAESKHKYHHSHMPQAIIIDGFNGLQLHVDGMEDSVRVKRV